jgi:serine/threonine protein kinase/CRP-like cAMP-binding protein
MQDIKSDKDLLKPLDRVLDPTLWQTEEDEDVGKMKLAEHDKIVKNDDDYQTLFWMPKLLSAATTGEDVLREMIDMIDFFFENEDEGDPFGGGSIILGGGDREAIQILGDFSENEAERTTRIEVVPKSEATKLTILGILKSHFLFCQLHDFELDDVIDSMQEGFFEEGDDVIVQGENGDNFYVIEEGRLNIVVDGNVVGEVKDGAFGEVAIMFNSPRTATIRAATDCVLWLLDRNFFRQAMVTSSSKQSEAITHFLSNIKLFQDLSTEQKVQMACTFTKQTFADGDYIITQGEIGEHFFVLFQGQVVCTKSLEDGTDLELIRLNSGAVFGERALIKQEPRGANVISVGTTECLVLNKVDFANLLEDLVDKMIAMNEFRILQGIPVFRMISDTKLQQLSKSWERSTLYPGNKILCDPETLFIVLDGSLISTTGQVFSTGKIIGTIEDGSGMTGSLSCHGKESIIQSVPRKSLDFLNEPNKYSDDDDDDDDDAKQNSPSAGEHGKGAAKQRKKVEKRVIRTESKLGAYGEAMVQDLEIVRPLGKGTFGQVYLAKHKATKIMVALKVLDRIALVEKRQAEYIIREAHTLQSLDSPFISDYYGVVLSPTKIFFMLEYVGGGDLYAHLYKNPDCPKEDYGGLSISTVAIYGAMILLALDHMHIQGIAYRDLKPENLLLGLDGTLKLIDFGFCKPIPFLNKNGTKQYRTYTLCGTPDYIAPEVILTQGHDKGVDYWSYGIVLFELLSCRTPFAARTQRRTFEKIVHSQKFLNFPKSFNAHAKSLIRKLLHPNPGLRFGNVQDGAEAVKKHAFFEELEIDFQDLLQKQVTMPYLPTESMDAPVMDLIDLELEGEDDDTMDDGEGGIQEDYGATIFNNIILNPLTMEDLDDD